MTVEDATRLAADLLFSAVEKQEDYELRAYLPKMLMQCALAKQSLHQVSKRLEVIEMSQIKNESQKPDISTRELAAIQRRVESDIAKYGIPSDEELHNEIEAMNRTAVQRTPEANLAHSFRKWKKEFVSAAKADGCNEFRRHLEHLGMGDQPETMLQGTLMLMPAVMAYRHFDGQSNEELLCKQKYWLEGEGLPRYCLTFSFGPMVGRILTDERFAQIDFADLFGHLWYDFRGVGFDSVWISRLDGKSIDDSEFNAIESHVLGDLYFDYDESEVAADVAFMDIDDSVLLTVQRH